MADLTILSKNKHLIQNFIENPKRVPNDLHQIRVEYWEKNFGAIKGDFKEEFSSLLTAAEVRDIEKVYHLRNMIAHAHVSVGRDYMLYRPYGGTRRAEKLIADLDLKPIEDQSDPMMLKLEFWRKEVFANASNIMVRLDQFCMKKIADHLGIPHGRIR